MATKSFTLGEPEESEGKGPCAKLCMCLGILGFVGLLGFAGVYVYNITYGKGCTLPELDEYGLSNWTNPGNDHVAFTCFPGYFLDGESNLQVATCKNGKWDPLPGSCNSLPIRIDCEVNNQSLTGNLTMWQRSLDTPAHIYGVINYTDAMKSQGHIMEHVMISKKTCTISNELPTDLSELDPDDPEPKEPLEEIILGPVNTNGNETNSNATNSPNHDDTTPKERRRLIRLHFHSPDLKAYKSTDVFINIIFVDHRTTATLVSVHQHNLTLVQTNSDPLTSVNGTWSWDKESRALRSKSEPRNRKGREGTFV